MSSERYAALDAADPLAGLRDAFELPPGIVYLDGNSLGALPRGVAERIQRLVSQEWGRDLIGGWNRHDWIGLPQRVGERIARLLGAGEGQVVCTDSTSVNLFKMLCTGLELNPGRSVVLSQDDTFPTDLYMAQGLSGLLGENRCRLRLVAADDLPTALGEDVAVLLLSHVNFRDGRAHDVAALTRAAHEQGALVLWDLAHSAGVMELKLDAWRVDMAVGCGYKFLNGGPGAPAFLYLAKRHQGRARQPLSGWMGHRSAFDFCPAYEPAAGVKRFLAGTPAVLGLVALDAALDVFGSVSMADLRARSLALTAAFMEAVDDLALPGVNILSPREDHLRASQVSLAHEHGFELAQALIEAGVIVDFRAPDIVRFGFSPLYNRFADVGAAVAALRRIVETGSYLDARYRKRGEVT